MQSTGNNRTGKSIFVQLWFCRFEMSIYRVEMRSPLPYSSPIVVWFCQVQEPGFQELMGFGAQS